MKRYFVLVIVIVLLLLALAPPVTAQDTGGPPQVGLRPDAPTYALHGSYWVGTQQFEAKTDFNRPTSVTLWYPALNPGGAAETITYRQYHAGFGSIVSLQGHAIKDATPDMTSGPYPLVIFAHGLYMARITSSYLTEHLASQGFVVMAIDYADSSSTGGNIDFALSLFTRPKDVSWQIDYADTLTTDGGALQGMIDTQKVAVVGHSYGGYTALAAAGSQIDLSGATSWCIQYPDLQLPQEMGDMWLQRDFCDHAKQLARLAGLETVPAELWPSWGDPRVDAIVPLAPSAFFGSESVKGVIVPTMVMVGSKDRFVNADFPLYQPYVYENLSSSMKSLVVFKNADHMIDSDSCEVASWLVEANLFWLCSDPVWDMNRAHDLINHFATAFLLDVLKGDKDAAAALAPDAVSFPGIDYKAEGF